MAGMEQLQHQGGRRHQSEGVVRIFETVGDRALELFKLHQFCVPIGIE